LSLTGHLLLSLASGLIRKGETRFRVHRLYLRW